MHIPIINWISNLSALICFFTENMSEDRYLTPADIMKIAGRPFNVVKFGDLCHYKDLDDLFQVNSMGMQYQPVDDVLILYEMKKNSGHWCTLKRIMPKGHSEYYSYHFLDPYGEIIDSQRKHINKDFRVQSGQGTPLILRKLNDQMHGEGRSGVSSIHYNDKKLQGPTSSTCGRYAGLFIRFNEPVEKFAKRLQAFAKSKKISVDEAVIRLTANLLTQSEDHQASDPVQ